LEDLLFGSIYEVKLLVLINAHYKLIRTVLHSARHILVYKIAFRRRHHELEGLLCQVAIDFCEVHPVVPAEAQLVVFEAACPEQVEYCVYF